MNYEKLEKQYVGQGCSTYSKRSDQYVYNHPTHILDSSGPRVMGNDQKWYIDTSCGLGSNLLNINNNFSKPHYLEPIVAELLKKKITGFEKVKFFKTGSSACSAAVRYARAYTGKNIVCGMGYHGSDNIFIAAEEPGVGCFREGYCKFNNIEEMTFRLNSNVAAVIIEPVQLDATPERKDKVKKLRDRCTELGIVLIFDEVITGFRVPHFSVSKWWGIKPDLMVVGKALGNGFPIAAVLGDSKFLDFEGVFLSNTHNGDKASLQEAYNVLQKFGSYELRTLCDRGRKFQLEINKVLPEKKLQLEGYGTRGEWRGDPEYHAKLAELCATEGVLIGKAFFITLAHDAKVLHTMKNVITRAVEKIEKEYKLQGYIPQPVFKRN